MSSTMMVSPAPSITTSSQESPLQVLLRPSIPISASTSPTYLIVSFFRGLVNAINSRQLHRTHSLAASIDLKLTSTSSWIQEPVNRCEFLDWLNAITTMHPEALDHIPLEPLVTVSTTEGYADCLLNFETHGVPKGVTRQSVAQFRFWKRDDRWFCYRYEAVHHSSNCCKAPWRKRPAAIQWAEENTH